ncbi:pleckstrin [Anaeramoeba ignava]|uniref:Pleckstrin n=1 Tax=Anaeramoeba ignava TaxID=1746090 RepID=A0A9Q0LFL9_ANAIG|nr:pleckstrin [Anaeramoeba ignava]
MQEAKTLRQKKTKKIHQISRIFINNIDILIRNYLRPLEKNPIIQTQDQILSKEDLLSIFRNIKQITILVAEFLYKIEYLLMTWEKDYKFGDLFVNLKNRIEEFFTFQNSQKKAQQTLTYCESNPKFVSYCQNIQNKNSSEGYSMKELLDLALYFPFVLNKYSKKLLLVTDEDHPDHQKIEEFIHNLDQNLSKIFQEEKKQKKKEAIEYFKKIQKIQKIYRKSQNIEQTPIQINSNQNQNQNPNPNPNQNSNQNQNQNQNQNLNQNQNQNQNLNLIQESKENSDQIESKKEKSKDFDLSNISNTNILENSKIEKKTSFKQIRENTNELHESSKKIIAKIRKKVNQEREIIYEGPIHKISRKKKEKRHLILCNDIIVVAGYSLISKKKLTIHWVFELDQIKTCDSNEFIENIPNSFSIKTPSKSFIVMIDQPEEKMKWISKINKQVNKVRKEKGVQNLERQEAPIWIPDDQVNECAICHSKFSLVKRRHHCRNCGNIICGNCSPNKCSLPNISTTPKRVCNLCLGNIKKKKAFDEKFKNMKESQTESLKESPRRKKTIFVPVFETQKILIPKSPQKEMKRENKKEMKKEIKKENKKEIKKEKPISSPKRKKFNDKSKSKSDGFNQFQLQQQIEQELKTKTKPKTKQNIRQNANVNSRQLVRSFSSNSYRQN